MSSKVEIKERGKHLAIQNSLSEDKIVLCKLFDPIWPAFFRSLRREMFCATPSNCFIITPNKLRHMNKLH